METELFLATLFLDALASFFFNALLAFLLNALLALLLGSDALSLLLCEFALLGFFFFLLPLALSFHLKKTFFLFSHGLNTGFKLTSLEVFLFLFFPLEPFLLFNSPLLFHFESLLVLGLDLVELTCQDFDFALVRLDKGLALIFNMTQVLYLLLLLALALLQLSDAALGLVELGFLLLDLGLEVLDGLFKFVSQRVDLLLR